MQKGKLIAIEGIDGAGKSEQVARLAERLRAAGIEVLTTREPGGTPIGEAVRAVLLSHHCSSGTAEMLLFQAARAELVETKIRPHLESGGWVITDRYSGSTIAYQGYGRSVSLPAIGAATDIATQGLQADLTLWLDVTPETADGRTQRRTGDGHDEMEKAASRTRASIIRGYAEQCDASWRRIDGEGSPEETETLVWREVEPMTNS